MKNSTTGKTTKAETTKKRIYEAGRELFIRYGIENVSVDAIVEKAAVAKGTFYIHYPTKDMLIAALIDDRVKQLDIDYQAHINSFPADTSAVDLLFALVENIVQAMTVSIGYDMIRFVYTALLSKSVDADRVSGYSRGVYATFRHVIETGVIQGEFRADLDADSIARHCVLSLRGLAYEWCIRYPDFDFRAQALRHFTLLLQGFVGR